MIEDWVTEPEDDDSRETREVFALAGLALYCAQCLEREIVNILSLAAILRRDKKGTGKDCSQAYEKYIDRVWDEGFRKTLGGLITSVGKVGVKVPPDLRNQLIQSLDTRNHLAHVFFREKAEAWYEPNGKRLMATELTEMREQFVKTDRALHALTEPLRVALGLSDRFVERYAELREQGVTEDRALTIAIDESRANDDRSPETKIK
jgi:hypothetical protein